MEPPQKKLRLDGVTVARTDDSSECSLPSPLRDSEDPDSDDDSGNSLPPEIDSDDEDDMNIWVRGRLVPQSLPESHVDVVELFSPPRVVPACAALGLAAGISVDIQNDGTDLSDPEHQHRIMSYIQRVKPKVTIISPPCTFYSQLTVLWNRKKRTPEEKGQGVPLPLESNCMYSQCHRIATKWVSKVPTFWWHSAGASAHSPSTCLTPAEDATLKAQQCQMPWSLRCSREG